MSEHNAETALATLYVNLSSSRCGWCNASALPSDESHTTPSGWGQAPGCGARFIAVSSDYTSSGAMYERIKAMRPDLPFIDPATARTDPAS